MDSVQKSSVCLHPNHSHQITEGCANQCLSMPLLSSAVPGRWQVLREHTMSKWVSVCR